MWRDQAGDRFVTSLPNPLWWTVLIVMLFPRLITQRSHEKLSGNSRLTSKQSVKLAVVERAMHDIGRDAESASNLTVSKLDKFLSTDD